MLNIQGILKTYEVEDLLLSRVRHVALVLRLLLLDRGLVFRFFHRAAISGIVLSLHEGVTLLVSLNLGDGPGFFAATIYFGSVRRAGAPLKTFMRGSSQRAKLRSGTRRPVVSHCRSQGRFQRQILKNHGFQHSGSFKDTQGKRLVPIAYETCGSYSPFLVARPRVVLFQNVHDSGNPRGHTSSILLPRRDKHVFDDFPSFPTVVPKGESRDRCLNKKPECSFS